ncbi:MAG: diguanylate cyclase [Bdellovibrionota bacterium]
MDSVNIHVLEDVKLTPFLERYRKSAPETEASLQSAIKKILKEMYDIVPCESIFLLLDDPIQNFAKVSPRNLTYIAGVGHSAQDLLGLKTVTNQGLISQTYNFGSLSVLKASEHEKIVLDKLHLPSPVESAICAPIRIEPTIGVLTLVNKKEVVGFTIKDVRMVNILLGYLQMTIQNAIDTKKIHEQTKRDNLTGLYNDRFFHQQLEIEIKKAHKNNTPLSLMFLDLDHFKNINDQYGHLVGSQTQRDKACHPRI